MWFCGSVAAFAVYTLWIQWSNLKLKLMAVRAQVAKQCGVLAAIDSWIILSTTKRLTHSLIVGIFNNLEECDSTYTFVRLSPQFWKRPLKMLKYFEWRAKQGSMLTCVCFDFWECFYVYQCKYVLQFPPITLTNCYEIGMAKYFL